MFSTPAAAADNQDWKLPKLTGRTLHHWEQSASDHGSAREYNALRQPESYKRHSCPRQHALFRWSLLEHIEKAVTCFTRGLGRFTMNQPQTGRTCGFKNDRHGGKVHFKN